MSELTENMLWFFLGAVLMLVCLYVVEPARVTGHCEPKEAGRHE